ncbi:TlyA family RNA methyltransferase [Fusibacter sp. JL216-2]|uniref:TlyA family RNA methyltransferase n=1 Tax=Fusibacter sp. JL216-2 TaxID=3071453 RepID=UPI003D336614
MKKERLDVLLVELGEFESREKAKRNIMAGLIFVDGQRVDKAGTKVKRDSKIEVKGKALPYVSRGGLKLEKAIKEHGVHVENKVCMDIGASTGGFTDCMLQNGASKVYSVDVGYGQLDWKLRNDERVVNMERTNIRHVTMEDIGEAIDFVSIDVSFISLKLVLPVAYSLMAEQAEIVFLIKPQFEAGKEEAKKEKGVIKNPKVHQSVIEEIVGFASGLGFKIKALTFSPITGPAGNIEFLCHAVKGQTEDALVLDGLAQAIVESAHNRLK